MKWLTPTLLLFLACFAPLAMAAPVRIALVVGNNSAQTPELEPLSFADDDACRTSELLDVLGFQTRTLTRLDQDSLATADQTRTLGEPSRDTVIAELQSLVEQAKRVRAEGLTPVLYFAFAGHGSYDAEGRGFLHLADGRLTLRDLVHHFILPTQGLCDVVIILDSCNAEFLLKSRGAAARRPAGRTTLRMEDYRHVGLILSSSATGEVREWGRFLGGVFSHQLRSALMGGADQDCDGLVTFPELAAFLEAANAGVTNPELRLEPYVRAPLDNPGLVVASPSEAVEAAALSLDLPRPLRLTITDKHMARRADLHLDGRCPNSLTLVPGQPYTLSLYQPSSPEGPAPTPREFALLASKGASIPLSSLGPTPSSVLASRGTDAYLQEHLFEVAFGARFFAEYMSGPYQESLVLERSVASPWYQNPWGWVATGAGVAAVAAGSVFMMLAGDAAESARNASWAADIDRYNRQVERYNLASGISWAAAGAALLTGTLVFLLDDRWETEWVVPQFDGPLVVRPNEVGLSLEFTY